MRGTTSQRLKTVLAEKNLRQVDVLEKARPYCEKFGVKLSKSDLSQYVTGKVIPGQDKLTILGLTLGVNEAWLMGYDVEKDRDPGGFIPTGFSPLPDTDTLHRVGRIACGEPILAEQNIEDYDSVPSSWRATFTLICVGDSMAPRIQDGDLVAIRQQKKVENGEIAAVRIGDEATLKRVYFHDDYIELRPENPAYSSIIRRREEMDDVSIEGLAVGFCRKI